LGELENAVLISLATEDENAPTDATSAVVIGETPQLASSLGFDPAYLSTI